MRSIRCRLGFHRWAKSQAVYWWQRPTWRCTRCYIKAKPCNNCGEQHDPTALFVVCTVKL